MTGMLAAALAFLGLARAENVAIDVEQARPGFDPSHANLLGEHGEAIDLFTGGVSLSHTDVCFPGTFGLPMCVGREYSSKVVDHKDRPLENSWAGLGWKVNPGGRVKQDAYLNELYAGTVVLRVDLPGHGDQYAYLIDSTYPQYRAATDSNALWGQSASSSSSLWVTRDFTFVWTDNYNYYALATDGTRYTIPITDSTGTTSYQHYDEWYYGTVVENPHGDRVDIEYDACNWTSAGASSAGAIEYMSDAAGHTISFGVDSDCRIDTMSYEGPSGSNVTWDYDVASGLLESVTNPESEAWDYDYDSAYDEIASVTSPTGGVTSYAFEWRYVLVSDDALGTPTIEEVRVVTTKEVDDGSTVATWEYEFDDYYSGTSTFGLYADGDSIRATRVHLPSGGVIDHYYGNYSFGYDATTYTTSYTPRGWVGQPVAIAWYESESETVPTRWVYNLFGNPSDTCGLNRVEVSRYADNPLYADSCGAAAVVPHSTVEGFDTALYTGSTASATEFGYALDGDYDDYANALAIETAGYSPYWGGLAAGPTYYFSREERTYAWEVDDTLSAYNLVHLPASAATGYPDGAGGLDVTWSSVSYTYSTSSGEVGWPTRIDEIVTGTSPDYDGDGFEDENLSSDRFTGFDYTRDTSNWDLTVTTDVGGVREKASVLRCGIVESETWSLDTDADGTFDDSRQAYTGSVDADACVLESAADENGAVTSYAYDDLGRLVTLTPPLGDATTYRYDVPGRTVSATTGASTATYTYDRLGRLSQSQSPNGTGAYSYLDVAYDEQGRVATAYLPHAGTAGGRVATAYDVLDRAVSVTRTGGSDSYTSTTGIAWPAVTTTDSNGISWTRYPDGEGRVEYTDPPAGATATASPAHGGTGYHARGVLAESSSDSVSQAYYLDQDGAPWRFCDEQQSGCETTTRDATGAVTCAWNDAGEYSSTAYDDLGRATGTWLGSSCTASGDADVATSWDGDAVTGVPGVLATFDHGEALGRPTGVTDRSGGTLYEYDAAGRVAAMARWWSGFRTTPVALVNYEFDDEGNLSAYELERQYRVELVNGPGGRVESVSVATWDGTAWDSEPLLDSVTYHPSGAVNLLSWSSGIDETWSLDELGRLDTIAWANSTDDRTWTYEWDGEGNLLGETDSLGDTVAHELDDLYRLERSTLSGDTESFTWDDHGNLEAYSSAVDRGDDFAARAHASNHPSSWSHDAAGRVTSDGTRSFSYDARGDLESASAGDTTIFHGRDAGGLLASRVTVTRLRRGFQVEQELFLRAPDGRVLARLVAAGQRPFKLAEFYVYAGGRAVGVAIPRRGTFGLHLDGLGTVRGNSDDTGVMGGLASYRPMGQEWDVDGELVAHAGLAWATHGGADALGIVDMRARSYVPATGRFLQPDPVPGSVEDPQSLQRYMYARGNPAKFADPSGGFIFAIPMVMIAADVMIGVGSSAFIASAAVGVAEAGVLTATFAAAYTVTSAVTGEAEAARQGSSLFEFSCQVALAGMMGIDAQVAIGQGGLALRASVKQGNGSPVVAVPPAVTAPPAPPASRGFDSFPALKKFLGPAGPGHAWHHVVEQTPGNIAKFGARAIHSTDNVVRLSHGKGTLHAQLSGYYSSKQWFTGGQTIRKWLSGQSFDEQREFGLETIKAFGG